MERPEQHEINTMAERIFQSVLPPDLVVRILGKDDYGIDAEIELFRNRKTTGAIFKVQLKGQKELSYISNSQLISFSFEIDKANYLIEQVNIPTAIILCDVKRSLVFWTVVHTNNELLNSYQIAKVKNQKTFTIHFPVADRLPDNLNELIGALSKAGDLIALQRASSVQLPVYAEHLQSVEDIDDEVYKLREKIEVSHIEKLYRLVSSGSTKETEELINEVIQNNSFSIRIKFLALMATEQVYIQTVGVENLENKIAFDLQLAQQLSELSRNADLDLQQASQGYQMAAQMAFWAQQDFALYINSQMQQPSKDEASPFYEPIWADIFLPIERTRAAKLFLDSLDQATKLVNEIIADEQWAILPSVALRFLTPSYLYLSRLKHEGLQDAVKGIENWSESILSIILRTTEKLSDRRAADEILATCAVISLSRANPQDLEDVMRRREQSLEMLEKISNKELRKRCLQNINRSISQLTKFDWDENNPDWESVERYYREQAFALGIDLDLADDEQRKKTGDTQRNPDAEIARIIALGIKDLNPTRVLKNCEHLFIEYMGGLGLPAQMLGLNTARMKRVGCLIHLEHGSVGGWSLDTSYAHFRSSYCNNCPDNAPHSIIWKYTEPWAKTQSEKLQMARKTYKKKNK